MDIIDIITQDHDDIATRIDELEPIARTTRATSDAMRLVVKLAVAVKLHAKAEEGVLDPALRAATPQLAKLALEDRTSTRRFDLMLDKLVLHRPGPELSRSST